MIHCAQRMYVYKDRKINGHYRGRSRNTSLRDVPAPDDQIERKALIHPHFDQSTGVDLQYENATAYFLFHSID